jgi:DNA-binding GntR family transcriptional regulator
VASLKRTHGSSREVIVAALRADIIEGRLPAGTPLRTEVIMERFGVSNSPLREAFAALAAEGLVEVQPNRGALVSPLTHEVAADLLRVGALLWETVYRWSIPRITAADKGVLKRIGVDFDLAYASGDMASALLEAERFDEKLLAASGSQELSRAVYSVWARLMRLLRLLADMSQLDARAELHAAVLAAIDDPSSADPYEALDAYWAQLDRSLMTNTELVAS